MKIVDLGHSTYSTTVPAEPFGTEMYRSPESLWPTKSRPFVDCLKSDSYSLGVLAYLILSGGYEPVKLPRKMEEKKLSKINFLALPEDVDRRIVAGLLDPNVERRWVVQNIMHSVFL